MNSGALSALSLMRIWDSVSGWTWSDQDTEVQREGTPQKPHM